MGGWRCTNGLSGVIVSQRTQNPLQLNGRENSLVKDLKQTPLSTKLELGSESPQVHTSCAQVRMDGSISLPGSRGRAGGPGDFRLPSGSFLPGQVQGARRISGYLRGSSSQDRCREPGGLWGRLQGPSSQDRCVHTDRGLSLLSLAIRETTRNFISLDGLAIVKICTCGMWVTRWGNRGSCIQRVGV